MGTRLSRSALLPDGLVRSLRRLSGTWVEMTWISPESRELGLQQDFLSNAGPMLSHGARDEWAPFCILGRHLL